MADNIRVQIGYSTDKTGLQELRTALNDIVVQSQLPGNKMNEGFQKAATTARSLQSILGKAFNQDLGALNVNKFNQELLKSNIDIKELKMNLAGAGTAGVTAFNSLSSSILNTNVAIKQSSKLLDQMAVAMANTVKWSITSSIFNNISQSIANAVSYAKQLDRSLNDIRIVTDKSAESMDIFAQKANNSAKALGASTLDYTQASLIYYQQGLSDKEAQARAETTLMAANVTGQTGETVSEQLTAVWNGYKVTAEETQLYVDKLAAVAATTASDLEELSTGMSKVASAANTMGVDVDQLNGMLSTIISVTRQAPETAGTALKTIFARMEDLELDGEDEFGVSLGEVSSSLASMGVQILDVRGNMRDLGDVIEEVGNKWNSDTWSKAEKQALAIDLAGKRQYNNLLALFNSWEMYTNAVNTSTNAVGTLQKQQDIYMQSTSAKLKTLKATWQDLYKGLIDTKELNVGIEGLTNLIQVFDNFIDSFGGGIKSIAAFGAVVSNIFNKQISQAITTAILNQEKYAQNVELLKAKMSAIEAGSASIVGGVSIGATDSAMQAQLETELRYAEQIQSVRRGISSEQYNELTAMQQKMGQLEYEATLAEQTALQEVQKRENIDLSLISEQEYLGVVSEIVEDTTSAASITQQLTKEIEKELSDAQELLGAKSAETNLYGQLLGLKERLNDVSEDRTRIENSTLKTLQKELSSLINNLDVEQDAFSTQEKIRKKKLEILQLIEKINRAEQKAVESAQDNANAVEQYQLTQERAAALRHQEGQIENEFNDSIEYAQKAVNIGQSVTAITSSLSSMAMAWSSINSMFQIWNDQSASLGDKITQTLMTVGIAIPMVISGLTKVNEAFGVTSTLTEVFAAKKELANAATEAGIILQGKEAAIRNAAIIQKTKEAIVDSASIKMGALKNLTTETAIAILAQKSKVELLEIGLTEAEIAALIKATAAQNAYNASLLGNPIMIVIVALAALVAITAAVISAQQKALEKQIELNQSRVDEENAIQQEIDANNKLYQTYLNANSAIDDSTESKEELAKAAKDLIGLLREEDVVVTQLTGDYSNLTGKILAAQREAAEKGLNSAQEESKAAEQVVIGKARQGRGNLIGSKYNLGLDFGIILESGETEALDILSNLNNASDITDDNGVNFNIDANNPKELIQLYDDLVAARKEMEATISSSDLTKLEPYKQVVEWVNRMTDPINQYKTSLEDIERYNGQLKALDIDFNNIDSFEDYLEKRAELQKQLQQDSSFASKSAEEQKATIDDLLELYGDSVNKFTERNNLVEALSKKLGEDSRDQIIDTLKNVSDDQLAMIATLEINEEDFYNNLENVLEEAQRRLDEQNLHERIDAIKAAEDSIGEGKPLEGETRKALSESYKDFDWETFDLSTPIKQLEILSELQRENNKDLLATYEANLKLMQAEEERKQKVKELTEEYQKTKATIEEFKSDENFDRGIDLSASYARLAELREELEKLSGQEIDININFDLTEFEIFDNVVDDILSKADGLKSAAELIGEGFLVAKEDAETFAKIYPALLENAQVLADGTIQLDQSVVQTIMNGNSAILTSDAEKTDGILQNKIAQLDAEIAYYETVVENLQHVLDGTISTEEAEQNIKKAAADYESNLREGLTNDQLEAFNKEMEGSETSTNVALENLDQIGLRIAAVSEAYAKMLTGEQVSYTPGGATGQSGNVAGFASSFNADSYDDVDFMGGSAKEQLAQAEATLKSLQGTRAQYTELLSRLRYGTDDAYNAMSGAAAGTGGKIDKSKSGSKTKDPDYMEYLDNEIDRYHDINLLIQEINTNLSRLDKEQKKLYGKDLLDNLNAQLKVLNQQVDAYKQKLTIAKAEAAEKRASLGSQGVSFSDDGYITNYAAALAAKENYVNSVIAQYNSMSADEQSAFKDTVNAAKKDYEDFKKQIDAYDDLISSIIPGLEDSIQDALDKQIEINIKKFTMEVELRLDMADMERDFNKFKRKVIDGIKDDDILGVARSQLKDYLSYFNTNDTGTGPIQKLTEQVNETVKQIEAIDKTGTSSVYGDNKAQAMEDLKKYYEELMGQLEDIVDLVDDIKDSYLDMIDEAVSAFDEQVDQYEYINDLLNHDKNLIGLLYGDDAYDSMSKYYEQIEQNNNQELDFLRKRADYAYEMMQAETDPEARKKWEDEWKNSLSKLNSKVEDSVQNIIDKYSNAIAKIMDELNKKVSGGKGLEYIKEEWDLINKNADEYLDNINALYAIQSLENKYKDALDATDSLYAQQKLNDVMNEQLDMLREKDKLTQYDVDRANMIYDLTLKQIALNDAQQNKSKMRLRRDSQGNYSYQYVSDEDAVAQARQELLDAQNDLYNFDKDAYRNNLDELYSIYTEFQEKMLELYQDQTLSAEEREQREALLVEQYQELINGKTQQNIDIRNNLYESAFADLAALYDVDVENFTKMSQDEQNELMENLIPQWESGVQQMADAFAGEGGFIPTCQDALDRLYEQTQAYQDSLNELERSAGINFENIGAGYDDVTDKVRELLYNNDELINKYQQEVAAILEVIAQLDVLVAQYNAAQRAAEAATAAAYAFIQAQQAAAAAAARDDNGSPGGGGGSSGSGSGGSSGGGSGRSGGGGGSSGSGSSGSELSHGGFVNLIDEIAVQGTYKNQPVRKDLIDSQFGAGTYAAVQPLVNQAVKLDSWRTGNGWYDDLDRLVRAAGYDTGGYTGAWDSSGRLAVLHEKELVLNKEDTANILSAVAVVRDIAGLIDQVNASINDRLNNFIAGMIAPISSIAASNASLEQDVKIEANFPNVHGAREIEEAFNNLVNLASQHAFNTQR